MAPPWGVHGTAMNFDRTSKNFYGRRIAESVHGTAMGSPATALGFHRTAKGILVLPSATLRRLVDVNEEGEAE